MKKYIFAVMMSISAGAMAHSNMDVVKAINMPKEQSIMSDQCAIVTQMVVKKDGENIKFDYMGTNEEIHQCVYMKEVVTKECVLSDSCMSYAKWTAQNTQFDVKLSRYEFTTYFQWKYLHAINATITMK